MPSATILVVEDEPILGLELQEDLQSLGYKVPEVIPDGDRVLSAVSRHHPDVILMDIKLYGFRDGVDAALQIRGFYKTPIVYLSSYPKSEMEQRVQKTAPVAYIEKPYNLTELRAVIEAALASKN
jgi:two-component system, response regulator PdtaR